MAAKLLNDDYDVSGCWFLPSAPDEKIAGRIKCINGSPTLSLDRPIFPMKDVTSFDEEQRYSIIHGVTTNGEAITKIKDTHRLKVHA